MNEIEFYLNSHIKTNTAAYVIDSSDRFNADSFKEMLSHSFINAVTFVVDPQELNAEHGIHDLKIERISTEIVSYDDIDSLPAGLTLLFENIKDTNVLLKFASVKPIAVVGSVYETSPSAFKLWETFRNCSEDIVIKTLRNGPEPQVLNWHKKRENQIELSVVFPVYNVGKYLTQCLESVTAWKADYVEYLFVDDGSPDNSKDIIAEWQKKDARIKLLRKENGGCASARQYGLDHAEGEYVGFIDPDDFIEPYMFCELLKAALTGSYEISYCGYKEYYDNNGECKIVEDNLGWPYNNGSYNPREIKELIYSCKVAIWRGIYKKEMLDRAGIHFYTDLRRFDDLPFKVETFAVAKSVVSIPKHMYYYRLARPGQDVSADDERLYVHFDIFRYLNESVASSRDQHVIDYLQLCKVDTHVYALDKIKPEFFNEYVKQARADFKTTGSTLRTYRMCKQLRGKKKAAKYMAIMLKSRMLYNMVK